MLIAVDREPQETSIAYEELKSSAETDVIAVHYKHLENRWTQVKQHTQEATED